MKEKSPIRPAVKFLVPILVTLFAFLLCLTPFGAERSLFSYDILLLARGTLEPPKDIVVVAIDEPSFDEVNLQWPWPRSLHAKLIENLFEAGADTVALDILFSEPSHPEEDRELARVIDKYQKIVLATDINVFEDPQLGFVQEKIVEPAPITKLMTSSANLGFINVALDPDGFVRRFELRNENGSSFSLQATKLFSSTSQQSANDGNSKELWINFAGPFRTIPTVSYYQALDPQQFLPKDYFKNKLVLVGLSTSSEATAELGSIDHFQVPFSRWQGGHLAGVEVHANAAQSILRKNFIQPVSNNWSFALGIVIGILGGFLFLTFRPLVSGGLFLIITGAALTLSYIFLASHYSYLSPVYLLAPLTLCYVSSPFVHYWYTRKQKVFLRNAFSKYLSPKLVNQIISQPELLQLGGEELDGSVVFIDLAGFTSVSEQLSPNELIGLVNRHLGKFSEVILSQDGMIDKYIGDCIMAVFGIPLHTDDHAKNACSALLDIRKALKELVKAEEALTGVAFSMRAGVSSGVLIAGNVGGGQRFNYTVLGNTVNLSARLEGINKFYGTDVIISEQTAALVAEDFILRELDTIRVVGQQTPVTIFELTAERDALSDDTRELLAAFEQGRLFYQQARWQEAYECFQQGLQISPEDGPCLNYLERCSEFKLNPPPSDWDGVFQMVSK